MRLNGKLMKQVTCPQPFNQVTKLRNFLSLVFALLTRQASQTTPTTVQLLNSVSQVLLICCLFSWRYNPLWLYFSQPGNGLWSPCVRGFLVTHNDASQSVGFLWTSDQSVADTSTWQHTTLTSDRHPWNRWDSNPQSQQASGRRPTP
jgi:hypothetical protein